MGPALGLLVGLPVLGPALGLLVGLLVPPTAAAAVATVVVVTSVHVFVPCVLMYELLQQSLQAFPVFPPHSVFMTRQPPSPTPTLTVVADVVVVVVVVVVVGSVVAASHL